MGDRVAVPKPHITALDVDPSCLDRARQALYAAKTLREVPPHIRSKWFTAESSAFRLDPAIRNMVSFVHMDILKDPLPEFQDIIFCRYLVFTYFHGRRRRLMLTKILNALAPHGCVILGRKEGLNPDDETFIQPVSGVPGFYVPTPRIRSKGSQRPGKCSGRSACRG
jgi:chemotaxis protein methyltransferase CheR